MSAIVKTDDLVGRRFGCWQVLRDHFGPEAGVRRRVWCRCECGSEAFVIVANLLSLPNIRCKASGCTERRVRARRESA